MANSKSELTTLATDDLKKGIIDTILEVSPFMANLPWEAMTGNSVKYNLETAEGGVTWVTGNNDSVTESASQWEQRTAYLYGMAKNAKVDHFMATTRKQQDLPAISIKRATKDIASEFANQCVHGGTTAQVDAASMIGLMLLAAQCESSTTTDLDGINNTQVYSPSDTGALALSNMDALTDRVRPNCEWLMMNRILRRKLTSLATAAGNNLQHHEDKLGYLVDHWGEIPIYLNDKMKENIQDGSSSVLAIASYDQSTTKTAGYDNQMIFAGVWGKQGDGGVGGLHAGNATIQVEPLGISELSNSYVWRLWFYASIANFSKLGLAVMINVQG